MIRVLIVDDEAPARARLKQLVAATAGVEVAGEAASGTQAMEAITELRPDVVLLDIEMPGANGMDVAASLPHPRPAIIFCTAFNQYAVDAFELNAVDYLLKPVSRARLAQAIQRIQPRAGNLETLIHSRPDSRFLVRDRERYVVVPADRVQYFAAQDGLTRLVAGGEYWMDPTLNDLEKRLDANRFFRISRAAIVAFDAIAEVVPLPGGSGEVLLKNGEKLEVSRRRFRDLLRALSCEHQS